ncbi:MAG: DotG/IcmE/VirB10 family protein [Pseudobdellovibrionaceae bacterium]
MTNSKDDFDNPDFEPDVQDDVDFSDLESEEKSSSLSTLWSTPLVKFGLIGAGVVAAIAAFMLFGGDSQKALPSHTGSGKEELKQAPGTEEVTPQMNQALEEKNKEMLEKAIMNSQSSIPVPIQPPKVLIDVPTEETTGEDPLIRWKKMQEERVRVQREQQMAEEQAKVRSQADPNKQAARDSLAQSMMAYMQQVVQQTSEKPSLQHTALFTLAEIEQAKDSAVAGLENVSGDLMGVSNDATDSGIAKKPDTIIIPAGSIQYAQMLNEANSDVPGPVLGMIVTGPFSGSRIMGTFTAAEEHLVIQFSTLVTKKGTSIPIKAFAVDPDTSLVALASDVDHRYLERIILPAAASFIEGLGAGYAETTTTVTGSGDSATSSTTDLNTKQELGTAVENMASTVGEILQEDGSKAEPLIRVYAGTPMGLMFMAPVTDRVLLEARQGYNSEEAAAQQQANQASLLQSGGLNGLQQLQQSLLQQQLLLQQPTSGTTTQTGSAQ